MTDLKYSILEILYHRIPRQETIVNLVNIEPYNPSATRYAIIELIEDNLIKNLPVSDIVELTPLGATAYENAVEERKHQSEQKRQQRFDNKISVASVLVPLITFIFGIIVESQFNIVGFVISFFQ